ncbi:MAG: hypothetical protein R3C32_00015 [Chloroflexota bacterium]
MAPHLTEDGSSTGCGCTSRPCASRTVQLRLIGIQYQQGSRDMAPASDLAEGLLNEPDRPPVRHIETGRELYARAKALPLLEVDEGSAVDGLVTNRVWTALGLDPAPRRALGRAVRRRLRLGVRDLEAPCRHRISSAATPAR